MGRVVFTDQSGKEHAVPIGPDNPVVSIGRATDCTIRSNKKSVSRNHAELRWNGGNCQVVDLDSSNGTYIIVNGERQPVEVPEPLNHNDEVWCGDFILYYYESDERDRGAAPPSGASDLESYQGERAGTREEVQHPSSGGFDGLEMESGAQAGQFDGPESAAGEVESGGFEEIEPEVIGEVDEETYEEMERLRAEKESIEDLASRQAVDLEEAQQRIDELEDQLEGARDEISELESELEFERNDNDKLAEERDEAERRVEQLEARLEEFDGKARAAAGSADVDEMRACVKSLGSVIDALGRTDLEELSTVDRIRLQSAIEQAEPETNLARLEDLVGVDGEPDDKAE